MDIYKDAAVVRALASHQCGPSSIPGLGVVSGLNLLLVLVFALRGFFRVLPFSALLINVKFDLDYYQTL